MALDARTRSSIYDSLVPVMGEDNANALMSEFPSVEADDLVTKQFLRAELSEFRVELGSLRAEMTDRFHQQSVRFGVALAGALTLQTAVLGTLITLQ